jgi:Penicillinase repressor.
MNKLPQISEAEFEVMKIVWKYAPISTNEITEKLVKDKQLEPQDDSDSDQASCNKRRSYL